MAIKNSLTEQSFFLVIGRTIAYLVSILLPLILVRIFTQTEYGVFKQIFLIFNTLLPFGQMGVAQSIYYFLPRHPEKKDALMTQTFIFVILTGSIVFCFLIIFKPVIGSVFNNSELTQYIPLLAVYSFFMIGSSFLEISMIAESKAKYAALTFALSQIVNSSVLIISAMVTESLFFIMCGAVLFSFLRFVVQCVYLRKNYRISLKLLDYMFWKKQLAFSLPVGFGNLAWLLQTQIHKYFVSYFFNPLMFAVYSVGCFKLPLVTLITSSASNVMIPAISRYQKESKKTKILEIWNNAIRKMNFFFFPVVIFFFIMAREFIVVLFTINYAESVPIFKVSLLVILISGINPGVILQAYAETKYIMKIGFARLPVTVAILYFFINKWGMMGAVIADVLTMIIFRLIFLEKVKRVLIVPFSALIEWKTNLRILLIAFISGIPVVLLKGYSVLTPLGLLITATAIYASSYFTLSILTGVIKKSEVVGVQNYLVEKMNVLKKVFRFTV